jgi:FkbM family methyltransferase
MLIGHVKSLWIFGKGSFSAEAQDFLRGKSIQVLGVVDSQDFNDESLIAKIRNTNSITCPIVIAVFNHIDDPLDIVRDLKALGLRFFVSPAELVLSFPMERFVKYFLTSKPVGMHDFETEDFVRSKLEDKHSHDVLSGFLSYQSYGQFDSLLRSMSAEYQYLGESLPGIYSERWMGSDRSLAFLDLGAFDGDTLRAIVKRRGLRRDDRFLCIEPDKLSFSALYKSVNSLGLVNQVQLLNVGVGERNEYVIFSHSASLASSAIHLDSSNTVDDDGLIQVLTLNDLCAVFRPTHIKMDIEGAEQSAIQGGLSVIRTTRPHLAVSIYHSPTDILQIPKLLMQLLDDYSWFMRSYGAHGYDTILYGLAN